jgi:trehalose 6-phosphate phosphatase
MSERTRRLLKRLARCYPCVVISGRSLSDVSHRCRDIGLAAIVGNHGLEPSPEAERYLEFGDTWSPWLRRALRAVEGISVENKRLTISVHYRRAKMKTRALAAIDAVVSRLEGVESSHGLNVVNLVPLGAPNKATALMRLKRQLECPRSLFVGDDITDEAVFEASSDDAVDLAVRIGRNSSSAARYYLKDRAETDRLLVLLLRLAGAGRTLARSGVTGRNR